MDKRSPPSFTWTYAVVLVLALAIFGVGIYLVAMDRGWTMLAAGCASLVAVLITWPLAQSLSATRLMAQQAQEEMLNPLNERMQQIAVLLTLVSEQQLLSDRAKSVAFREKDRDALRRAIREEMAKPDWEAALALVNDMEATFGYRQESERFREEIGQQREESLRKQIAEVMAVVDRHCRAEKWNDALREAERLMQMFPGNEQVMRVPQEIDARRQAHKKQLLDSWSEAVARKDIDGSIEILKKLDIYLTPSEAESMQEAARGIFKAKLDTLRAQFASAVQDHNWAEAIRFGDAIIRDFPNTRIAQEMRDTMTALHERAGGLAPAGA